jgi:hypothetical protein
MSKPMKPNSSNFFRYRAEHLRQQQTQSSYTSQGLSNHDPQAKQEAYYERPSHQGYGPSSQVFGSAVESNQNLPDNFQQPPITSSTQMFPTGKPMENYQPVASPWNQDNSRSRSPDNPYGTDYDAPERPLYENIVDIEKRVSMRMLGNEEVVQTKRTRTDIFGEPAPRQTPTTQSSRFLSQQSLPSVNSINAITARPEASMRKLHIFEKLANEENEMKAAQKATKGVVRGPTEGKEGDKNVQVIKAGSMRKQDADFQDFGQLVAENRRLAEELHRVEVEHGQLVKDPRNMNVQETNFRILLEASMTEDRKVLSLRKDNKLLDAAIVNKQSELGMLRSLSGARNPNVVQAPDYKEKERLLNEIEKTRAEISAKRVDIDNQKVNEASKAARVREISERQMNMELEGNSITINNSEEALLKELLHFQKELL